MANTNSTRIISPVTLSQDWPTLGRLLFLTIFSTIGTILNGFFVAAFVTERPLRRSGNVYLACVGLCDLIITTVVMPTSVVVLLSGQWDTLPICQVLQFLTEMSTYGYSLFFTLVATETYYRMCHSEVYYKIFLSYHVGLVSVMVFAFSAFVAGIGVYMHMDYDYCQRLYHGCLIFRTVTFGALHVLPFFMTLYGLFKSSIFINRRARIQVHYRRSEQYDRDYLTTKLNIVAYMFYVTGWVPYLTVMFEHPTTSDPKYYNAIWAGMLRSVLSSIVYCGIDKYFRRAFTRLFYYCCFKSSLSEGSGRHRRIIEYTRSTGEVRVHIMHQAFTTYSPHRIRLTTEL